MNLKAHSLLDHFFYASPPCAPTVNCICPDYVPSVPRKFNFVRQVCPKFVVSTQNSISNTLF